MYYYCIENQQLISILNHEPAVPESVTVVKISAEDHLKIQSNEFCFDIVQQCAVPMPQTKIQQIENQTQNQRNREFLDSTDWKILRHLREQTLGLPTSLSQDQYRELERQREEAARAIDPA
jgi:hypothetical protein